MLEELGTSHGRPRRVDVRVPVEILCSKGIRLSGKTRNVSEGGMFVETALLLPVGSPVRCDLALERSAIEVFGRIAWSRPRQTYAAGGMGIQFVGYEAGARRVLCEVVASGDPIPRLIVPEVTARIPRRRRGRLMLAAVFSGVALATAGVVVALLPTSAPAAGERAAPTAAARRVPIAAADGEVEEVVMDAPVVEAAGEVAIVPRADGTTAVSLPVEGEVAVRHLRLAEPDGIALFFEGGRTTAELRTWRRAEGAVHQVWVGADGREVRLFTRGAAPTYRVDRFEHTLRVLLDPPATAVSR